MQKRTYVPYPYLTTPPLHHLQTSPLAFNRIPFVLGSHLPTLSPFVSSSTPTEVRENPYTLPNFLTATRLLAAPAVGYLLITAQYTPALALFSYAGATDLVDGWLARRMGTQTVVGTVLDPMADKALMTSVVVCLAWGAEGALPGTKPSPICFSLTRLLLARLSRSVLGWCISNLRRVPIHQITIFAIC